MLNARENTTSEDILVLELCGEMLSLSQVAAFLNWFYLVNKMINYCDFLHADKNFENMKGNIKIIDRMCSKMGEVLLSASQIAEVLHRPYLKNELMN